MCDFQRYRTYKNKVFYTLIKIGHPPHCHAQKSANYFDYGLLYKIAIKRIFALNTIAINQEISSLPNKTSDVISKIFSKIF